MTTKEITKLDVFEGRKIRKAIHNDEWWFSVVDVCGALTDSPDAGAYWRKLKQRLKAEGSEVVTNCHGLKLEAADGKKYTTDCAKKGGQAGWECGWHGPQGNRAGVGQNCYQ